MIRNNIPSTDKVIAPHKYKFENTCDAAKYNTSILKRSKYDLTRALLKDKGTMLEPGSEFRSSKTLQPLLSKHENWDNMEQIITEGV